LAVVVRPSASSTVARFLGSVQPSKATGGRDGFGERDVIRIGVQELALSAAIRSRMTNISARVDFSQN
jgi:hypothetical protein